MNAVNHPVVNLAYVVEVLKATPKPAPQRRDLLSAISRMCDMLGCRPEALKLDIEDLRVRIGRIRPAAHGISKKTLSNIRSAFAAALEIAGVIAGLGRGDAKHDPNWAPLVEAASGNKRVANGLAAFMNWCARQGIPPEKVSDEVVQRFGAWLQLRTLHPKPRDLIRGVPKIWNDAGQNIEGWPPMMLARISFRPRSENMAWGNLPERLRTEAEAYLKLRAEPDLFETDPSIPKRPLAPSTVRQQSEHIRLATSVLVRQGAPVPARLADLVELQAFKAILRHYYNGAGGKPNAFAVGLAKTLIDIARYQVKVGDERLRELKAIAAKLPSVPHELTEKNQELLRLLENEKTRARLLFMPEDLIRGVEAELRRGRLRFVDAQVAIATDILLLAPLRPENLIELDWQHHFKEPQGRDGPLLLYVPKEQTKSRKRDLTFELSGEVAKRIRWYRREIMPRLGADPNGRLFVCEGGRHKHQETLTQQIIEQIAEDVGIHMTPHQFRHVAAYLYLEEHPEDFQSMSDLLGHAWAKTTLIYAGSSSRRASKAYGRMLIEKREGLKLKRGRPRRRKL